MSEGYFADEAEFVRYWANRKLRAPAQSKPGQILVPVEPDAFTTGERFQPNEGAEDGVPDWVVIRIVWTVTRNN